MTDQADPTFKCLLTTICGFMLPFFLVAAGGNADAARAAIIELIDAYNATTSTELDLVGRLLGFSIAAMDNLKLSMNDGLSDTKVLRYRSNAVALGRASEQVRKILQTLQEKRENTRVIPRPAVAPAPPITAPAPKLEPTRAIMAALSPPTTIPPMNIEALKGDARLPMAAFSRQAALSSTAMPVIANPASLAKSAAAAAIAAIRRT